ncbi:MAG: hypothetical protein NTU44_17815, partial [Bacteroidetes bacterium]|nr:hypothetical protein [Bacteroidota bacterium]
MNKIITLVFVGIICCVSAFGQQVVMHFPQTPDLSINGMGIHSSTPLQLGDDWLSTATGPVTEIDIWGCWFGDMYSPVTQFSLQIFSDVPASGQNPSHPGSLLWEYIAEPGTYPEPVPTSVQGEGWYDPISGQYIFPGDFTVWYYSFNIDPGLAYNTTIGVTYWLVVTVNPFGNPNAQFGWKTSVDHWTDKAVWRPIGNANWTSMVYPPQHPYQGQNIDLAFILKGNPTAQACCLPNGNCLEVEPGQCVQMGGTAMGAGTTCATTICNPTIYDFGDLPDTYSTLLASNGPRHTLDGITFMGNLIDAEANGIPTVNANG